MFPPTKILFPVDFSARCSDAARMVETFAGHFQAQLTLLNVREPLTYNSLPEDAGQHAQLRLSQYLANDLKHFDVKRVLLNGDPAHEIVNYAREQQIDLLMMPTHGYGPFRRFLIGSATAKVLHDADCPVWTGVHMEDVPCLEDISFRRIVCAVELGSESCQCLYWATQFADEFDAAMTIVHVVPPEDYPPHADSEPVPNPEAILVATGEVRKLRATVGSQAEISIVAGEVPEAVCRAARRVNADLLVIGRAQQNGVLGRLRTNAYSIIRQSACPVVSV